MSDITDKLTAVEDQIEAARTRLRELTDMINDDSLHGYAVLALSRKRSLLVEKIKGLHRRAQYLAESWVDDQIADEQERIARSWL